jgi:peptidoglycan/LPS O-acetylase OafA/YrhL
LIGVIFTANLIGFAAAAPLFAGLLRPLEPALRWAAGATFTLYLMHLPIAQLLLAISPWEVESWANRALILLGTLLVVFLLAEVTERRKQVWRQWVAWLLQRLLPEPMSAATPKR